MLRFGARAQEFFKDKEKNSDFHYKLSLRFQSECGVL